MNLDKSCHSVYSLNYHLVLVTKYRKKVFNEEISERLKDIVFNISQNFQVSVLNQEVNQDHVHILFKSKPTLDIPKYINSLKGVSSRYLRKEFEEIKKKLWGKSFWSPSYCLISSGQVSLDVLIKYIENQGEKKN
ncbi:MAG: IS200/IS605 family transposase [Candidatus Helarchaeota archaeon]